MSGVCVWEENKACLTGLRLDAVLLLSCSSETLKHILHAHACHFFSLLSLCVVFERQVREAKAEFKWFMTKERKPLEFIGLNSKTTIGMLCGHASFGIAALVYLETDPLTTR